MDAQAFPEDLESMSEGAVTRNRRLEMIINEHVQKLKYMFLHKEGLEREMTAYYAIHVICLQKEGLENELAAYVRVCVPVSVRVFCIMKKKTKLQELV